MRGYNLGIGLAVVMVATALAVVLSFRKTPPPQILSLPDGSRYQFAGVSYGTNHVHGPLLARWVNRLPAPVAAFVQNAARNRLGQAASLSSAQPSLEVWFERLGTNAPATAEFHLLSTRLVNQDGNPGGEQDETAFIAGSALSHAGFKLVPRRSPVLQLCLYQSDGSRRAYNEIGRVHFPNPLYRHFPNWKPEPVPAVKMAGDLEVRLENLMTGIRAPGTPVELRNGQRVPLYWAAGKGMDVETVFDVALGAPRGTNEAWVTQSAELSDATGNVLASPAYVSSGGGCASPMTFLSEYRLGVRGTLWPDEAAWRLKLELKRRSGLGPDEFVTFKHVPVPKMGTNNFRPLTNLLGGVQLVLKEFVENGDRTSVRYPRGTNASYAVVDRVPETLVAVEYSGQTEHVAVDFVKLTMDTGEELPKGGSAWRPSYRAASLRFIPTNVATVDITWVVQKMRTVEFLVKPTKVE